MFAPSINMPTQDVGHKCSLCSPQEAGVSPSSTSTLIRLLPPALSSCLSSSSTCQLHCPPLKKSKPIQACSCDLFQWRSPNGTSAFVPGAFLTRFWGNQRGGIRLPIEGGVAFAACRGAIMDHTWSCSSGSPRPGASVRGHRPRLCLLFPPNSKALFFSAFCQGPFHLARALPRPFVLLSGAPVPQRPLPSALFTPPTICHQQVFQKCNECKSFCQRECA